MIKKIFLIVSISIVSITALIMIFAFHNDFFYDTDYNLFYDGNKIDEYSNKKIVFHKDGTLTFSYDYYDQHNDKKYNFSYIGGTIKFKEYFSSSNIQTYEFYIKNKFSIIGDGCYLSPTGGNCAFFVVLLIVNIPLTSILLIMFISKINDILKEKLLEYKKLKALKFLLINKGIISEVELNETMQEYEIVSNVKRDESSKHSKQLLEKKRQRLGISYCKKCNYQLFTEDEVCPNCKTPIGKSKINTKSNKNK